jgi:uncharacterized protein (TIGR02246 family)
MRAPSLFGALVLTFAVVACSRPTGTEFDKADVESIRTLIQQFIGAYNVKDAAKVATFFALDAVVMPPNASTVRGAESIQQYYVARFDQGASDLSLDPKDIAGSGVLAYASGDYRLRMAPEGGQPRPDRGKFLFVLRDSGNGRWLLEYLMFSSDFAPTGPPTD